MQLSDYGLRLLLLYRHKGKLFTENDCLLQVSADGWLLSAAFCISGLLRKVVFQHEKGLAVLVLLSLASVPWLLINGLLWLIALAALSGSILAQLTYHIPSLRVVQTEYLYRYDFLMTICASVCVPISTYCTVYETEDDSSSTLYIALAAYPFDTLTHSVTDWMPTQPLSTTHFDRSSTNKASKLTVRSNEHRPLLQTYVGGYGYYQAF
ncbi:unnamed protein product [Brugia pahangi]|uniref:Pecanex-like protein n=1 Tax=Brugia pahangi TaxID=6280 RepID=A0A0N4T9N2_BRUPA|nr:unnamed protein product [Brugia pahangi]